MLVVILEMPPRDRKRFQVLYDLQENIGFDIQYALEVNPFPNDYDIDQAQLTALLTSSSKRLEEIADNPKYTSIMVCGRSLSLIFTSAGIQECLGKDLKYGDKKLIVNYSPARIYNQPAMEKAFISLFGVEVPRLTTPYKIVESIEEVEEIFKTCIAKGLMTFDFETVNPKGDALEWFREETVPTLMAVAYQPGFSYIIPMYIEGSPFDPSEIAIIWELFDMVSQTDNLDLLGHNIKYDLHFIYKYGGRKPKARVHDTLLMKQLLDENSRHGLKEITQTYFPQFADYDKGIKYDGPLEQLAQYASIDADLTTRFFYYFQTQLVSEVDPDTGHPDLRLYRLYRNYSMVACHPMMMASHRGAKISRESIITAIDQAKIYLEDKLREMNHYPEILNFERIKSNMLKEEQFQKITEAIQTQEEKLRSSIDSKIAKIESEIEELDPSKKTYFKSLDNRLDKIEKLKAELDSPALQKLRSKLMDLKLNPPKYTINYSSVPQLKELLYSSIGFNLPPFKDGMTGEPVYSTSRDYLSQLKHSFFKTLFAQRTIDKMISTYYRGILDKLDNSDFLHGNFNLAGTVTGRVSSNDPNLQNIPVRIPYKDEEALWSLKQVKKFFIPRGKGRVILQADFSQMELRLIANMADDKVMQQAYMNGEDLHLKTALQIHNLTLEQYNQLPEEEQKEKRNTGKPANFGWVYKASIPGYIEFAKGTYGIDLNETQAQTHKDSIFKTYPNIPIWHDDQEKKAKKYGYVRTLFGRKRRLPEIYSSIPSFRNAAIRNAINSPIQGTGGEITLFLIGVADKLITNKDWIFINSVHDSIYFDLPFEDLPSLVSFLDYWVEALPTKTYFKKEIGPVPMKLDYEYSHKSWGDMETYSQSH